MSEEKCRLKVGDAVIFKPSKEHQGNSVMTGFSALEPGNKYQIVRIIEGVYIVREGFESVAAGSVNIRLL